MPDEKEIIWNLNSKAKPYSTGDDFYYELVYGTDAESVLKNLIKNKEQLNKALEALKIISSLESALEDAGLWESC